MRDVADIAIPVGRGERLHQVPAAEVGAADVADLALANELVERRQRLFHRRVVVLPVQLEEVDVVGAEPSRFSAFSTASMRCWREDP